MTQHKCYGKLIGASLGPGDPELITRRAWAALQSGARWLYPVKKAEESSYALSIVARGGIAVPDDAVELVFPMTRDAEILAKAWARAAERPSNSRRRPDWCSWSKATPRPSPPSVTWHASCANGCLKSKSRPFPVFPLLLPLPLRPG